MSLPGDRLRPRLRSLWPAGLAVVLMLLAASAGETFLGDVAQLACLAAVSMLGWMVFCGPARELSFGHSFLVGSTAYLAALVQVRGGVPPWGAVLAGVLGGAALGALVGLLTREHRGPYFSLVTMALQLAFYRLLFVHSDLFGGEEGVIGVRSLASTRTGLLWVSVGALLLAVVVVQQFLHSRAGLLLGAAGQSEPLARGLGVDVTRSRGLGLVASGAVTGLAGALVALTQGQANAGLASGEAAVRAVLVGTVGGLWSVPGVVLLSLAYQGAQAFLFGLSGFDALILLVLLFGLALVFPDGVVPSRPRWTWRPDREPTLAIQREAAGGLDLRDVSVRFGGVVALDRVSLSFASGALVGVIGPNGAGKTSLLKAIAGEVRTAEGEIAWQGERLDGLATHLRARRGVRKTSQHAVAFPALTVGEHLEVARRAGSARHQPDAALLGVLESRLEGIERSTPLARLPPDHARMVEVAMALAAPPDLLLLDEPYAALSAPEIERVGEAVRALHERGVTILMVEHRLEEMFRLVEEVIVLDRGRVLARQAPGEVLANPEVRRAYGLEPAEVSP